MIRLAKILCFAAALSAPVAPALACRVAKALPTIEQIAAAKAPQLGFAGKVLSTFHPDDEKQKKAGQSVVQIEVTRDFSGQLPSVIYVFNPGCCVCVGIGGAKGEEVKSIIRRGEDGLFHLDY